MGAGKRTSAGQGYRAAARPWPGRRFLFCAALDCNDDGSIDDADLELLRAQLGGPPGD